MSYNKTLQSNNTDLQVILDTINALPEAGSGELPVLTNPANASELLEGKELIDGKGKIVAGSMPNNGSIALTMDGIDTKTVSIPEGYTSGGTVSLDGTIDEEVEEQTDLIEQIKNAANNLPEVGSGSGGNGTCTLVITFGDYVDYCIFTYISQNKGVIKRGTEFSYTSGSTVTFENVDSNILIIDGTGTYDDLYFTYSDALELLNRDDGGITFFKIKASNSTINLHIYSRD